MARWRWRWWIGALVDAVEAEDLDSPCQCFVCALLFSSPLQLFLVAQCWVPALLVLLAGRDGDVLRHAHVVQSIVFNGLVVEPWTIATLPFRAANHAELRAAATRHMIAPLLQLHGRATVETPLPPLLLRNLRKSCRGFVLRTLFPRMPAAVTCTAHLLAASRALPILPAPVRAAAGIDMNVGGLDPLAAAACGAVDPVLRGVFLIFLVPGLLELEIEEAVYVLEGDVVGGAAFGRHVLGVGDGQSEDAAETGVAHAVLAREFGAARGGDVGEAG